MPIKQQTVMVIDDSGFVLETTRSRLHAVGYRVITRDRAAGSISVMLKEEPDLVLIDVGMPGMGGDTLVRCFGKAHPASKSIVLLHSGLPEDALRIKATASGAHGYIRKTGDASTLVREVRRWLEPRQVSGTYRRPEVVGLPEPDALSMLDERETEEDAILDSSSVSASRSPRVVLLVDSDMQKLSKHQRCLSSGGLTFEYAFSCKHAMSRIKSVSPDAVVSALELPDRTGIELYQQALGLDVSWYGHFVLIADTNTPVSLVGFAGRVLYTPVDREQLRDAVAGCLTREARAELSASG